MIIKYKKKFFINAWIHLFFAMCFNGVRADNENIKRSAASEGAKPPAASSNNSQAKYPLLGLKRPQDWTSHLKKQLVYSVTAQFIKKALYFPVADEYVHNPPVVLVIVHGTWSRDSREFHDDSEPTYKSIKIFADKLAKKKKAPLHLLSFGWSGENDDIRRKAAGAALAQVLNLFSHKEAASVIYVIAHSHGGNVAHYASRTVKRPIDVLINLGTPTRDDYPQWSIDTCYNIYSTSDPVQVAGSFIQDRLYESFRKQRDARRQPYRPGKKVVNIHIKIDGTSPGHIVIKDILASLFELLEHVDFRYKIHDDLVANVTLPEFPKMPESLVAINDFFTTQDLYGKRSVDINLTSAAVVDQLRHEVYHSHEQEKKFLEKYPNSDGIRSKGSVISRAVQMFVDAYRMLKYVTYDYFNAKKDTSERVFHRRTVR